MSVPIEVIKQVPLFKGLSDKELKTLANNFTERAFKAGQELTSEGQGAAGFFVIESGEAAVTVDGEVRRKLASGDYFGEVALIDGGLADRHDHGDQRRQELRADAVAVPPARRGERLDRLAAARGDGRARARARTAQGLTTAERAVDQVGGSCDDRPGLRQDPEVTMLGPRSLLTSTAEALDRRVGWDKLPRVLAIPTLIGLRTRLRERNLYDTGRGPLDRPDVDRHPRYLTARTLDGTYNDLDDPLMGSLGSRFGRNVPLEFTVREPERADARAEPAPHQPRAADAGRVPACDDAQPARGRVDPVRGARLVQPRQERAGAAVDDPARRRRSVGRATRCRCSARAPTRARTATGRRRSSPTTRTGGTARRSTAATPAFADALALGRARKAEDRRARAAAAASSRRTST